MLSCVHDQTEAHCQKMIVQAEKVTVHMLLGAPTHHTAMMCVCHARYNVRVQAAVAAQHEAMEAPSRIRD